MSKTHVVADGEHIHGIADQYGFVDWKTIYEHPLNKDLRDHRPDPYTLLPGDKVQIPDKQVKTVDASTGKRHEYVIRRADAFVHLVLRDSLERPLKDLKYTLTVDDAVYEGNTGNDGIVHKVVSRPTRTAKLSLPDLDYEFDVDVGRLDPAWDPVDNQPIISGLQARLNNLAFHCGAVDGELGRRTKSALKKFQRQEMGRTAPLGNPDEETCSRLQQLHGG